MKLMNFYILSLIGMMCGGMFFPSAAVADETYDPKKVEQMSASRFWSIVTGEDLGDTQDFIICGQNSCKVGAQKCVVKEDIRKDVATGLDYYLGGFTGFHGLLYYIRGEGSVATYEYRCIDAGAVMPEGFAEAPEGGVVFRKKIVTGGLRGFFAGDKKKVNGRCQIGSDGNSYCLTTHNSQFSVNYNRADTAFRGCEVLPVKLFNGRKCFFCPLFTVVYKVAGEMTAISFKALAAAFAGVLIMGLAIWIAVQTLTQVSSLTKQDAPKFLTNLIKQSYKVLIAFLLLIFSSQIFEYAVMPVLSAGLEFGSAMLEDKYAVIRTDNLEKDADILENNNPGITQRKSMLTDTQYFTPNLYVDLDNFVVNVQRHIAFMQGVGTSLICIGSNAMVFMGDVITFGKGFQMTMQGVLLAGFGFLLSIAFAFYLVDAVVQMGIAGALMPFLIASWPFKLTSKYAATGWSMILNSAFIFVFAGMVTTVNLNLVNAALSFTAASGQAETVTNTMCDKPEGCVDSEGAENLEIQMGGLYAIAQAINTQSEADLVKLTDISTVGFLILLFCCIFGFKFMGKTSELAGKFAGGALKPIAPSIATMGASAAKNMALKSTQATREAAEEKFKSGVSAVASLPGRAWGAITGKKKAGPGGAAAAGGKGGAAGGQGSDDVADGDENLSDIEETDNGQNEDAAVLSEGGARSPAARNEQRAQAPRGRSSDTARLTEGGSAGAAANGAPRRNEQVSGTQGAGEKTEGAAAGKQTKVEKARRSGKRNGRGGKAKGGSRNNRNKSYKRNGMGRRK